MFKWLKRLFFGKQTKEPLAKRPATVTERPPTPSPTKAIKSESIIGQHDGKLDDDLMNMLTDVRGMSKLDLDIWARKEHKINLDRRQTKNNMIKELKRKLGEKS